MREYRRDTTSVLYTHTNIPNTRTQCTRRTRWAVGGRVFFGGVSLLAARPSVRGGVAAHVRRDTAAAAAAVGGPGGRHATEAAAARPTREKCNK